MKKRILPLLLALVMALAVLPAAAAENNAPIQVSGLAQGQTGFLAGYDDMGRMVGLRMLTANGQVASIPGATGMKLIRTGSGYAPQGPALSLSQSSATVRKVDGQVRVCYDGPNGLTVSQPVSEKITGQVSTYIPSTGQLTISGKRYAATGLAVEGCEYTVTKDGFSQWSLQPGVPFGDTLDFYLDSAGDICWIELVEEYQYPVYVCLILSVSVSGSAEGDATIQAQMMYPFGEVAELTVSTLDGVPITDPDAAVAQLSASAPGGLYACQCQRDGSYSLTAVESTAGSGWGQTVRLPYDITVYPQADFTRGAVSCVADDNTRFYVVQDDPKGGSTDRFYDTFGSLPTGVVLDGHIVTSEADPSVARFVYLHVAAAPPALPALPDGYVFLPSIRWWMDAELEDVCLVEIVDTDGSPGQMRVSDALRRAIADDSMVLGSDRSNALVGRFCAVTEIDKYRVVSGLAPAETLDVLCIADEVITLDGVAYGYGSDTKFIYVDMGWEDDPYDSYNKIGVREPDADNWVLWESGVISNPDTFFDAADVDDTGAYSDNVEEQNPYGATYISVKAAVIPEKADPTCAEWVYIVRELW